MIQFEANWHTLSRISFTASIISLSFQRNLGIRGIFQNIKQDGGRLSLCRISNDLK